MPCCHRQYRQACCSSLPGCARAGWPHSTQVRRPTTPSVAGTATPPRSGLTGLGRRPTFALIGARRVGLSFDMPVPSSLDPWALALSVAALVAIFRFKAGMIPTLLACAAAGVALHFALGVA